MNPALISATVSHILERDLNKVIQELNSFHHEENMWVVTGKINNTAGNLALHIAGAVNHFVGAILGKNGYVRTREKEFSDKHVSKGEIINKIVQAIDTVKKILPLLTENDMQKEFPEKIGGHTLTIGFFLIHLVSHINYHLGQINYHRRLLDQYVS